MLNHFAAALFLTLCLVGKAQPPDVVRKEIEATYVKALEALRQAKSLADLDEINRSVDTQDWQSIVPNQPPRTWEELRKYGLEGLRAPFRSASLIIDTFEVNGDVTVLTGRLRYMNQNGDVSLIPLKETWRKTLMGWKRQIHQKFAAGQIPARKGVEEN